jgi:transposase
VAPWRGEGQERAFVRFETAPGEQAQMDWGHFGNWGGKRLYGFALTLCWSRMQYVKFTQRQDAETLLNCMVHALCVALWFSWALRYIGGAIQHIGL